MREAGGRIVLMDFGAGSRALHRTRIGAGEPLRGTPAYLAPKYSPANARPFAAISTASAYCCSSSSAVEFPIVAATHRRT